jgi:hypothetical protein
MTSRPGILAALHSARWLIQDEYESMLASACPRDVDGKSLVREIDASYKPLERRYRRVLKKIDEAMK